uniref:CSON014003 protein n=1 Tax=Culicoides sonorensis TaxID=179676 RepID=A0A336MF44_CULSO
MFTLLSRPRKYQIASRKKKSRRDFWSNDESFSIDVQSNEVLDPNHGQKSTPEILALLPSCSLRPIAMHVDLYGGNLAIKDMTERMRSIAERQLSVLLEDQVNANFVVVVVVMRMNDG